MAEGAVGAPRDVPSEKGLTHPPDEVLFLVAEWLMAEGAIGAPRDVPPDKGLTHPPDEVLFPPDEVLFCVAGWLMAEGPVGAPSDVPPTVCDNPHPTLSQRDQDRIEFYKTYDVMTGVSSLVCVSVK